MHRESARWLLVMACLLVTWTTTHAQDVLPLKHGTYVERGTPCKDAPFAMMKSWDGKGIGDPHSSGCTLQVLHSAGSSYRVANTCTAQGDGTPETPDTERGTVTLLGPQSFRYAVHVPGATASAAEYRWCATQ